MKRERNILTSLWEHTMVPKFANWYGFLFMLNKISEKYNKNDIGLYIDDGLAVFKNISGPESERIKKNFQSLFKKHGL